MSGKYDLLSRYLAEVSKDSIVKIGWAELEELVGGLPPSAKDRTWWANTSNVMRIQAKAWMSVGRLVEEVKPGESVIFSLASKDKADPSNSHSSSKQLLNGVHSLQNVLKRAGYASIVEAVAAHTVFLPPDTVAQTNGEALFPIVRDPSRIGVYGELPGGQAVLFDDNTSPTLAFLWSAQRSKGPDVQYNHIWGDSKNAATYTALWNLCATPAFLAKTTDGSNHPEVVRALRYRAFELYGFFPAGESQPVPPEGYESLSWAPAPEQVPKLEVVLRSRLAKAPKSRPAGAARRLGWLFSNWQPDMSLG